MKPDQQAQVFLRSSLQQGMHLLAASEATLYQLAPDGALRVAFSIPNGNAFDTASAEACLQHNHLMEQETANGKAWHIYCPVATDDTLFGCLALTVAADAAHPQQADLVHLIAHNLAILQSTAQPSPAAPIADASTSQLMTIYEAISVLNIEEEPTSYVEQVAQTYQDLGWQAVRVTLYTKSQEIRKQYTLNPHNYPFWDYSLHDWQSQIQHADLSLDGAYVFRDALTLLLLPVKTPSDDVMATIELSDADPQLPISEASMRPSLIFARHFGNAIDRSLLIKSLRQSAELLVEQVDELEFIRRADQEISSRLDPDRIVKFTLDWAIRRTAAEAGCIMVVDSESQSLIVKEALGYPPDKFQLLNMQKEQGVIGRTLQEKRTQVVENVDDDPDYIMVLPKTRTQLAIPLVSHRRTLGAILLESRMAGRFDLAAISFVERVASMTAISLDNAQLLQQAEQLADDMSLMYNAGRTISSSLEWEQTIQSIAQGLALAVKGSNALIYEYNERTRQAKLLSIYTGHNVRDTGSLPRPGSRIDVNEFKELLVAIEDNRILTINMDTPDLPEKEWVKSLQAQAAGITPLIAQGECVGIAMLTKDEPGATFANSEIFVAESLATQAAAVLRQAALYTEVLELETLKSEMIRMASHDLRAPIANIMGYMSLLDMDLQDVGLPTDEPFGTYISSINRSVKTMDALVEDLLTLEKIESQRNIEWESLSFSELIRQVFEEQHDSAELKHQQLILNMAFDELSFRGNRVQLKQALSNLVGNGIKYTPDNGRIEVHSRVEAHADGDRVLFQVIDNGFGIPKARQARIFQRFYRAKQAGTEHIPGTGLGLSLVKSIIERHHGEIGFESEEGTGSTFWFWLPISKAD